MHKDKAKYFKRIKRLGVIGVSDWITKEAKESFFKDAFVMKRIYNWVDLRIFNPGEEQELRASLGADKKFIILSVASAWGPSKGFNEFLELAKLLSPEDYLILLVGNMSEGPLPEPIKNIPLVTNLKWLARLYRVSDVFISLSKEESFGKVIAEAIACGTPVITYNMTACPELADNNCGYIAKGNTLEEIYEGVEIIKANTKSYYTDKCVALAKEKFSKDKNIREYLKLYETLINGK